MKYRGAVLITNSNIGLVHRKCFNVLLAAAYPHLESQEIHKIAVWDLCDALAYRKQDDLKEVLEKLAGTVIKWNVLKTKDKTSWSISTLLAGARIDDDNVLHWSYEPYLREKLSRPDVYARISMAIQRRFRSKYSFILYEICCDAYITANGITTTRWITIGEFRDLMGCEDDKTYDAFKDLNKKLIKPAIKEVNEDSDIQITVNYQKQRRMVVALRFTVTPKPGGLTAEGVMSPSESPITDITPEPSSPAGPGREEAPSGPSDSTQAENILQGIKKSPLAIPDGSLIMIDGQGYVVEHQSIHTESDVIPLQQLRKGVKSGKMSLLTPQELARHRHLRKVSAQILGASPDSIPDRLVAEFGHSKNEADQIIRVYSANHIFEKMWIVAAIRAEGRIQSTAVCTLFYKALVNDYRMRVGYPAAHDAPKEPLLPIPDGTRVMIYRKDYTVRDGYVFIPDYQEVITVSLIRESIQREGIKGDILLI